MEISIDDLKEMFEEEEDCKRIEILNDRIDFWRKGIKITGGEYYRRFAFWLGEKLINKMKYIEYMENH